MGCASNSVDLAQPSPRQKRQAALEKSTEYEAFGDEIRQELDPTGSLERLLTENVIQAAWQLKAAIERSSADPGESTSKSSRRTAVERAARSVREAFEGLDAARSLRNSSSGSTILVEVRSQPEVEPNEWPVVPSHVEPEDSIADESDTPRWRDRLMFDFEVSNTSPVVKGTWVTVGHVVSLIVDGWTWADILRSHPELTEDDIRACVTYAMDEENTTR